MRKVLDSVNPRTPRRYVSTNVAAKMLNLHPNTVRNKMKGGEIPFKTEKRGGRDVFRIPESYVIARREREGERRSAPRNAPADVPEIVAKRVLEGLKEFFTSHGSMPAALKRCEEDLASTQNQLAETRALNRMLSQENERLKRAD